MSNGRYQQIDDGMNTTNRPPSGSIGSIRGTELSSSAQEHNMQAYWRRVDEEDELDRQRRARTESKSGSVDMIIGDIKNLKNKVTGGGTKIDTTLKRRNYFDRDGVIRFELLPRLHHPQMELQTVLQLDRDFLHPDEEMYAVNMRWLCGWINFVVHGNRTPGEITNHKLVNRKSGKVKSGSIYNKHWRPVNEQVWRFLHNNYSGSPVIKFKIGPDPVTTKEEVVEYMGDVRLHLCAQVQWPNLVDAADTGDRIDLTQVNPETALGVEAGAEALKRAQAEAELKRAKEMENEIKAQQAEAAKTVFMAAEGARQLDEGKALEEEANKLAGEAALNVLNKAKGDEMMKEAEELGKQHAEATSELAGAMMQDMMAEQAAEDARRLEAEAQADVMAGAANLLGQSAAVDQMKMGMAAQEELKSDQAASALESFKAASANSALSDALNATGSEREQLILEAAARKLQAAWRSRLAKQAVMAKRAERDFLLQDGAARMLQSAWRRLNARKDVARKRAERDMLMQKSAAMKFQSAWRRKKARERMAKLKAERQAKLEEGAAWKLQACYRIRQARKKTNELRAEAQRLKENGASMMLQAAWRRKQARAEVARLRLERQQLLEHGAAVLLQSTFRAHKAKELVGQIKKDIATNHKMSTLIGTKLRQHLAKKRTKELYRTWRRPFRMRIVNAKGLPNADYFGSSDPFVVVTALEPDAQNPAAAPLQKAMWKTKTINDSLEPVFDEEVTYSGCNGYSTLVFTVLDKDMISLSGSNDLLGQCSMTIAKEALWEDGHDFTVRLPLGPVAHPVFKADGKPFKIDGDTGAGELVIEFKPRNTVASTSLGCERFCHHDESSSLFGNFKTQWSKRWLVVTDEGLHCHETTQNLNSVDKFVAATDLGPSTIILNFEERDTVLQVARMTDPSKPLYFYMSKQGEALMVKNKLDVVLKRCGRSGAAAAEEMSAAAEASPRKSTSKKKFGMF